MNDKKIHWKSFILGFIAGVVITCLMVITINAILPAENNSGSRNYIKTEQRKINPTRHHRK